MKIRSYLSISGTVFALVALAHLLRLVAGWELVIGEWQAPGWVSLVGMLVPGALAGWAFRLAAGPAAPSE